MRLCWNDGFGRPLGKFTAEDAKFYRDIGCRVVGVNPGGSLEATEDEIENCVDDAVVGRYAGEIKVADK